MAAAVLMPPGIAETAYAGDLAQLTDSKLLTPARREWFEALLTTWPGVWHGLGWTEVPEIDDLGIGAATRLAMGRAIDALPRPVGHVLIDGLPVRGLPCPSTAIVKGDQRSLLIAAASVLAKVHRDRRMIEIDRRFPGYGFARHKGYGTAQHMQALLRLGPCPEHRHSFRPVAEARQIMTLNA